MLKLLQIKHNSVLMRTNFIFTVIFKIPMILRLVAESTVMTKVLVLSTIEDTLLIG
jgi:hypothetical protein